MELNETIKRLMDIGAGMADVRQAGGVPFIVAPKEFDVKSLEPLIYNEHREFPERKVANVEVRTPGSFISYWTQFFDDGSQAFADDQNSRVMACLDYHFPTAEREARWRKHWVTLQLEKTDEWKTWLGKNGTAMDQEAFAEFLEDNAPDIIDPVSTKLAEYARELKSTTGTEFRSKIDPKSGAIEFTYQESVAGKIGKSGSIDVPERFTIAIPIFLGMSKVTIEARFRFRAPGGKLSLWYQLYRPKYHEREAFQGAIADIEKAIGKHVFIGKP